MLRGVDDSSLAASARSTRSLSSMTGGPTEMEHDFSCPSGVETYLNNNKVHHITKGRMDTNFFNRRLDGQRHAWIHALNKHHCQYCHYVWANEFDDAQRVSFHYKKQNKYKIIRCLVCNVNLCNSCDHEFHGVQLGSSKEE